MEYGRESQMEDIDQLITYVKSIQMDLEDTMDEVGYLLEQLQSMKDSPMKLIGLARNTYYKYKRELKAEQVFDIV